MKKACETIRTGIQGSSSVNIVSTALPSIGASSSGDENLRANAQTLDCVCVLHARPRGAMDCVPPTERGDCHRFEESGGREHLVLAARGICDRSRHIQRPLDRLAP